MGSALEKPQPWTGCCQKLYIKKKREDSSIHITHLSCTKTVFMYLVSVLHLALPCFMVFFLQNTKLQLCCVLLCDTKIFVAGIVQHITTL